MAELFDILTSDSNEVTGLSITADHGSAAWDTTATITIPDLAAGDYMMVGNFLVDFLGQKDNDIWIRLTGTHAIGTEFSETPSTNGDMKSRTFGKKITHAGGACTLTMEMSLGTGTSTVTAEFAQVVINRAG